MRTQRPLENPVSRALKATRADWLHVAVFSTAVNLLMLTGSIYMLQVYDRVLSSRSIATLVMLSLIVLAAFMLQGLMDAFRLKLLSRIGAKVDEELSPLTARAAVLLPIKGAKPAEAMQPMRDLDSLRGFLSSLGPTALIDMPFMPLFVLATFVLHPWLGWLAVVGGVLILCLTLWTERRSAAPTMALMRSGAERAQLAEGGRRNAEVIRALGMGGAFAARFQRAHSRHVADNLLLADAASGIGALARIFRFGLQSAVLGLGAYLVIKGEMGPGAMIAASILTSRALAPIELAVAHWKGFVAARQGYQRLKAVTPHLVAGDKDLALPKPSRALQVSDVVVAPPGSQRVIVQGVSFEMKAGQALGLIGPSGSGKSSLARALVGVWPALRGAVKLDGARLEQWEPEQLGGFLGYLPQDVELFDGSIAENIARFDASMTSESVLAAAKAAGAHDLIVSFPEGYDTAIGEGGAALSGGQRQRLALARALYGDPFMVVLDEPNASLDAEGDEALTRAIQAVKARGGICVVITHRPSGLAAVDLVGAMAGGKMQAFGPREDILQQMMRRGGMAAARRPQGPGSVHSHAGEGGAASVPHVRQVGGES
jgi:ATP-binding cassette subfamily C protein